MDLTNLTIHPDVISKQIQNEEILLHLQKGFYFSLNETGSLIWNLLKYNKTYSEVVEKIIEEYDTDLENAKKDINKLVDHLYQEGLLIQK